MRNSIGSVSEQGLHEWMDFSTQAKSRAIDIVELFDVTSKIQTCVDNLQDSELLPRIKKQWISLLNDSLFKDLLLLLTKKQWQAALLDAWYSFSDLKTFIILADQRVKSNARKRLFEMEWGNEWPMKLMPFQMDFQHKLTTTDGVQTKIWIVHTAMVIFNTIKDERREKPL